MMWNFRPSAWTAWPTNRRFMPPRVTETYWRHSSERGLRLLEQVLNDPDGRRGEVGPKQIAYLERNRARMSYQTFRDAGYFIGSGVLEAACKTVVGQRLKQSGILWSRPIC
jgi:hypothetical protein